MNRNVVIIIAAKVLAEQRGFTYPGDGVFSAGSKAADAHNAAVEVIGALEMAGAMRAAAKR
jgi:hypothetical protein